MVLNRLLGKEKLLKEAQITVLGPSQAGKTTLIHFLETGDTHSPSPLTTLGVEYRQRGVKLGSWSFKLIDVGGQKVYQNVFWELVVERADALVYIVDATVKPYTQKDLFEDHISAFNHMLSLVGRETLVLVLLNKQDLTALSPITSEEFAQLYPIDEIRAIRIAFLPTSAKFGNGVEEAMSWLVEKLDERLR